MLTSGWASAINLWIFKKVWHVCLFCRIEYFDRFRRKRSDLWIKLRCFIINLTHKLNYIFPIKYKIECRTFWTVLVLADPILHEMGGSLVGKQTFSKEVLMAPFLEVMDLAEVGKAMRSSIILSNILNTHQVLITSQMNSQKQTESCKWRYQINYHFKQCKHARSVEKKDTTTCLLLKPVNVSDSCWILYCLNFTSFIGIFKNIRSLHTNILTPRLSV